MSSAGPPSPRFSPWRCFSGRHRARWRCGASRIHGAARRSGARRLLPAKPLTDQRPLAAVPPWLWLALGAALSAQLAWQAALGPARMPASHLPPPPSVQALRLASFGEAEALSRLSMLYLQAFNMRELDYGRLTGWLGAALELDPRSQYPLFAASRIYAEHPDPARSRAMLEFVYQQFLLDPDRRWL